MNFTRACVLLLILSIAADPAAAAAGARSYFISSGEPIQNEFRFKEQTLSTAGLQTLNSFQTTKRSFVMRFLAFVQRHASKTWISDFASAVVVIDAIGSFMVGGVDWHTKVPAWSMTIFLARFSDVGPVGFADDSGAKAQEQIAEGFELLRKWKMFDSEGNFSDAQTALEQARKNFEELLQRNKEDPVHISALLGLATIYLSERRLSEIADLCEEAFQQLAIMRTNPAIDAKTRADLDLVDGQMRILDASALYYAEQPLEAIGILADKDGSLRNADHYTPEAKAVATNTLFRCFYKLEDLIVGRIVSLRRKQGFPASVSWTWSILRTIVPVNQYNEENYGFLRDLFENLNVEDSPALQSNLFIPHLNTLDLRALAHAVNQDEVMNLTALGWQFFEKGDRQKALEHFERALLIGKNHWRALSARRGLALCHMVLGNLAEAKRLLLDHARRIDAYATTGEVHPDHWNLKEERRLGRILLAKTYIKSMDHPMALQYLTVETEAGPQFDMSLIHDEQAVLAYASASSRTDRPEETVRILEQSRIWSSPQLNVLARAGVLYFRAVQRLYPIDMAVQRMLGRIDAMRDGTLDPARRKLLAAQESYVRRFALRAA